MIFPSITNPWVILGLVVALGGAYAAGDHRGTEAGRNEVQVKWDRESAQAALKSAENVQRARDTEALLQKNQEARRKKDATTIANLDRSLRAATDELSKRPERPGAAGGDLAAGTGPAGWCTGAGLYRDDGLLLRRQADLSQRIRVQRDTCYAAYDDAKEEVRRLKEAAGLKDVGQVVPKD